MSVSVPSNKVAFTHEPPDRFSRRDLLSRRRETAIRRSGRGVVTGIVNTKRGPSMTFMRTAIAAAAVALSVSTLARADMHGDIVEVAAADGRFTTLVAAIEAAGLVETLQGEGPFTVFAPTDEAFAALPEGTVEDLLKPENRDTLVAVLTYHVVPGKVMSSDIAGQEMEVATVQGSTVEIDATDGVMVDGAHVIVPDVDASNGVIHVIDAVIMP
jgi:uncharacterized surface protein with fasciclin (FAS1) repeats